MSMESEALEKLLSFAFVMSENMVGLTKGNYDKDTFIKKTYEYLHKYNVGFCNKLKLKQALYRLEHIENANPSKALELVGYLKDYHLNAMPYYDWLNDIEKYILKAQEQFDDLTNENAEYKEVLKIIKEKMVNILLLELAENVDEYNEKIVPNGRLTSEEFDLLKKWSEGE